MKITNTNVECFSIRKSDGLEGWASIYVHEIGTEHGRLIIASDFGEWQFQWSFCGMPFKKFLTTVGMDYVGNKFRVRDYIEFDQTIKRFKQDVIDYRRNYGKKEFARKIFDEIENLDDWYAHDRQSLEIALAQSPNILRFYDSDPPISETYQPLFVRFWNEIWLPFIDHLKTEIKQVEVVQI